MDWRQLVVSAFVGAVIGYTTNWIAIKMLFRPLAAKYLLGLRLPFTPGVIPKEKGRLARSIGDVVSDHLLTNENISKKLQAPEIENKFISYLKDKIEESSSKTIGEVLFVLGTAREEVLAFIKKPFLAALRNEKLQNYLAAGLTPGVMSLLARCPAEMTGTEDFYRAKKGIISFLKRESTRSSLKDFLRNKSAGWSQSTLTLKEALPGPLVEGIRYYINKFGPRVIIVIQDYLELPETKNLLVERIEKFFERNTVNKFMGNVLVLMGKEPGQLADSIVDEVADFFSGEKNRELLMKKIEVLFEQMLDQRICDIISGLDSETRQHIFDALGDYTVNKILSEKVISDILETVEDNLQNSGITWKELLGADDCKVEKYLQRVINKISSSPGFEDRAADLLNYFAGYLFKIRISDVLQFTAYNNSTPVKEKMLYYYRYIVKYHLPGILDFINVNNIVRQRVDELDVQQVEELLLHIIRRELVAITWLGAVLGAFLGITMVVLQVFA